MGVGWGWGWGLGLGVGCWLVLVVVVACWLLVVACCLLLVACCWLLLLVVGCWLLVVGCWLFWVVGCGLRVVGCGISLSLLIFISIFLFLSGMALERSWCVARTRIRTFTFPCADKLKETRETLRCPLGARLWAPPPVLSPVASTSVPQLLLAVKKNTCGQLYRLEQCHHRIDGGDDLGEKNPRPGTICSCIFGTGIAKIKCTMHTCQVL